MSAQLADSLRCPSRATFEYDSNASSEIDPAEYLTQSQLMERMAPPEPRRTPSPFAESTFGSEFGSEYDFDSLGNSHRLARRFGHIRPTAAYSASKLDALRAEIARREANGTLNSEDDLTEQSRPSTISSRSPSPSTTHAAATQPTSEGNSTQVENTNLRLEVAALREKLDRYAAIGVTDLELTLHEHQAQLDRVSSEKRQLQEECQRLAARNDSLQYAVDHPAPCALEHGSTAEQDRLLQRSLDDSASYRQKTERLEEENERLRLQVQDLIDGRAALWRDKMQLGTENDQLQTQLEETREAADRVTQQLHQTLVELDEAKSSLLCYEGQVQALQQDLAYARSEAHPASPRRVSPGSVVTSPSPATASLAFPRAHRGGSILSSTSGTQVALPDTYSVESTRTTGLPYVASPRPGRLRGSSSVAGDAHGLETYSYGLDAHRAMGSRGSNLPSPRSELGRPRGLTESTHGGGSEAYPGTKLALECTIEKLRFELRDARQRNLDKAKRITDLEGQLSMTIRSLKVEDAGHRQRLDSLQQRASKYSHERSVLAEENESLRQRYDDFRRRVEELEEAVKESEMTGSRLRQELATKDAILADRADGRKSPALGTPDRAHAGLFRHNARLLEVVKLKETEIAYERDRTHMLHDVIASHKADLTHLREQCREYSRIINKLMGSAEEVDTLRPAVESALGYLTPTSTSRRAVRSRESSVQG